jgi:hypothetical protein
MLLILLIYLVAFHFQPQVSTLFAGIADAVRTAVPNTFLNIP